jgi:hypothetical protein
MEGRGSMSAERNAITSYREERYEADADCCWPPSVKEPLLPGVMRVLYFNGVADMVEYLCPCGCGCPHPTFMPTQERKRTPERHLWEYKLEQNGPTLTPSIRCLAGCKSHYNIEDGKVIMHGDSGK